VSDAKKNVVLIFSGPCKHKWHPDYDYYTSLKTHIIEPLLKRFGVYIFIGCAEHEKRDWQNELIYRLSPPGLSGAGAQIVSKIFVIEPVPEDEDCRFNAELTRHPDRLKYSQQYGKLYQTARKAFDCLEQQSADFHYVIKLRFDLIYNSLDYFDPNWLTALPDYTHVLLAPSTEFHCLDRWKERSPSMWPDGMCEQIVAGNKRNMKIYFDLYKSREVFRSDIKVRSQSAGIESIVADHLLLNGLTCKTFDLQFSQPGGKHILGYPDPLDPTKHLWLPQRENKIR